MGQCPHNICGAANQDGYYNFFNNSWAYNVTEEEDKEWYDLIEELCPLYIGRCGQF